MHGLPVAVRASAACRGSSSTAFMGCCMTRSPPSLSARACSGLSTIARSWRRSRPVHQSSSRSTEDAREWDARYRQSAAGAQRAPRRCCHDTSARVHRDSDAQRRPPRWVRCWLQSPGQDGEFRPRSRHRFGVDRQHPHAPAGGRATVLTVPGEAFNHGETRNQGAGPCDRRVRRSLLVQDAVPGRAAGCRRFSILCCATARSPARSRGRCHPCARVA